jgi:hypothetical protein
MSRIGEDGRFTSAGPRVFGMQLGRSLDPLDTQFGYPVEVVGSYARERAGPLPHPGGVGDKAAAELAKTRKEAAQLQKDLVKMREELAGAGFPLPDLGSAAPRAPAGPPASFVERHATTIAVAIVVAAVVFSRKG